jgi:hypothetical protein
MMMIKFPESKRFLRQIITARSWWLTPVILASQEAEIRIWNHEHKRKFNSNLSV